MNTKYDAGTTTQAESRQGKGGAQSKPGRKGVANPTTDPHRVGKRPAHPKGHRPGSNKPDPRRDSVRPTTKRPTATKGAAEKGKVKHPFHDDGTTCTVTPLCDGLSRVDITMRNDSRTLATLRKLADHAGVTVDQYVGAKLTQAALEASKAKESLTLPADVAATFRETAAILGRDPQSWTTAYMREAAAELADPVSGLLLAEITAGGLDPAVMRRFRAYCDKRGIRRGAFSAELADARRAQRKAA